MNGRPTPYVSDQVTPNGPEVPAPPRNIEQLGLPRSMVVDLVLRFLREHGSGSITALRKALKLPFAVAHAIFQELRQQQFIEVKGTAGSDYVFTLTGAARQLAAERSDVCRYAGPAPVPLDQYADVIRGQRAALLPSPAQLREALADLVIADDVVEQLGPALASGRPLFIYGPTGNGKTSIMERLARVHTDTILVPYCVEVDAHIISVFDPLVHRAVDFELDEDIDQRWIRCRRPCVMAAGELVGSMLNLRLDDRSGVYAAPLQMKAANGILLIDDFGRQAMPPHELFNRWILPLDRRVDCLSLDYGFTFQIPFEITLAFATNLEPSDLVDEAFLRRVPNKIFVGPVTPEAFDEIFRRVLTTYGLPFDPELAECLRTACLTHHASELRACYPNDICEILVARGKYRHEPVELSPAGISRAAAMYFTHSLARSD